MVKGRDASTLAQILTDPENQPHQFVGDERALLVAMGAAHYHANNGTDDSCAECGLDLRNVIHHRSFLSRGDRG